MADPKMPGIYAIRNTTNGKCYVGSAVNIARRWTVHRSDFKAGSHRCKPLQRAWDKHGKDTFIFDALEFVANLSDLIPREQHWIDTLQSHCERNGYNVCPIADSRLGMKMPQSAKDAIGAKGKLRRLSQDQKAAISAVHKGKTISITQRTAQSLRLKGKKRSPESVVKSAAAHRALGRRVTAEQKAMISKVHKGKKLTQEQKDAVRNAHLGKKKSPESIAKMRIAQCARRRNAKDTQGSLFRS